MSDLSFKLDQTRADIVTVKDAEGATVWEGTTAMFGLTLAAMRKDLHREWRCVGGGHTICDETEPYGPVCGWIVWFWQEPIL